MKDDERREIVDAEAASAPDPGPAESLSALLDGELPPEQTDFLLKRVRRDATLRATLARYQAAGDVLRGERAGVRAAFALRVSAAIAAEPPLPAVATVAAMPAEAAPAAAARSASAGRGRAAASLRPLFKPMAGLAVAATVAGLAVLVLQREPLPAAPATLARSVPAVPVQAPLVAAPAPLVAATVGGEPASYVTPAAMPGVAAIPPAMLANYVVAHSEFSSPLGRRNVLAGLIAEDAGPAPLAPQAPKATTATSAGAAAPGGR